MLAKAPRECERNSRASFKENRLDETRQFQRKFVDVKKGLKKFKGRHDTA
jgi:hypothetical protein